MNWERERERHRALRNKELWVHNTQTHLQFVWVYMAHTHTPLPTKAKKGESERMQQLCLHSYYTRQLLPFFCTVP